MATPENKSNPQKLQDWRELIRQIIRWLIDFVFTIRNKRGDVLDGWLLYADNYACSAQEFYDTVEKEVAARKLPDVQVTRISFAQGGPLSQQRTYLRFMRERLALDVSAAQFGRVSFFSCRIVQVPVLVRLWHIVAACLLLRYLVYFLAGPLGEVYALIAAVALLFALAATFQRASAGSADSLDSLLLRIPLISTFYQDWFRPETYYRADTRQIYREMLPEKIREIANQMAGATGITLIESGRQPPVHPDLFPPPKV